MYQTDKMLLFDIKREILGMYFIILIFQSHNTSLSIFQKEYYSDTRKIVPDLFLIIDKSLIHLL
jgi:hypothetical protein